MIGEKFVHNKTGGGYLVVATAVTKAPHIYLNDFQEVSLILPYATKSTSFRIVTNLKAPDFMSQMKFPAITQWSTKKSFDKNGIRTTIKGKRVFDEIMFWTVYQSMGDNQLWVRPEYEFQDGRFSKIPVDKETERA